jgi:hypothetical protein
MFNGFSGSLFDSKSYSLFMIFPTLFRKELILILTGMILGLLSCMGLTCVLQMTSASLQTISVVLSMILFVSSGVMWLFSGVS